MRQRSEIAKEAGQMMDGMNKDAIVPLGHPLTILLFEYLLAPKGPFKHSKCEQCRGLLGRDWKFCAHCGEPLS